ncbi:hypothetical protein D910_08561 [Dendroctonus ponderosae]|uniref:Carboxylic ester hydrolase n=1 Tax=Dendroctonus ponderosae TaxID=77166 RepID=U4UBB7_DENPD|nr:hypothetical protein D910_08561 [Dendroctonus ponderosae]
MLNKILLILMLCLGYQISLATCEETVEITIPDGTIRGQVNNTVRENVTFYSFRGIPYAKPPVGNLRFASPVKNSAWSGVYNATYDRSECYQNSDGFLGFTFAGQEDCLYINVYTPDINASGLPVLVWIHGGSFLLSNSSYAQFAPDFFLEQDLVFVSFNYRMGVFGFLSTEDEACPENWGIKNQLLALRWVQENVAYFGGDPKNVTISGESAESVSVNLLSQTNIFCVFGFLSTEDEACPGNWGIKDQLLALQWVQDNVAYFGGDPNNVTISGESAGSVSVHLLLHTNRTTEGDYVQWNVVESLGIEH